MLYAAAAPTQCPCCTRALLEAAARNGSAGRSTACSKSNTGHSTFRACACATSPPALLAPVYICTCAHRLSQVLHPPPNPAPSAHMFSCSSNPTSCTSRIFLRNSRLCAARSPSSSACATSSRDISSAASASDCTQQQYSAVQCKVSAVVVHTGVNLQHGCRAVAMRL